jgi:MFS family permease
MPETKQENELGGGAQVKAPGSAIALICTLVAIYMISQFFRNSINVIGPDLSREFDLDAQALSMVASTFFLSFALVQIPLGMAIDRYGPKICLIAPALILIAGTLLFAVARDYRELVFARLIIGVGCSSFLMAPLTIYAERFSPARFGSLVGMHVGAGNVGALAATAPLALATAAIGWRWTFASVAIFASVMTLLVFLLVRDSEEGRQQRAIKAETLPMLLRGVREAAQIHSFWPVFGMQMTVYPAFGAIVGLWSGPWLAQVYGLALDQRGHVLFMMALAQIVGLFAWGTADRFFGSYKKPCLIGGMLCCGMLVLAALVPIPGAYLLPFLIVMGLVFGFSPALTAHGKALFPRHLIGRGLSLLNIGAMGGVFFQQWITGLVMSQFASKVVDGARIYPPEAYRTVFALLAAEIVVALIFYSTTRDPHPDKK